jgi:hypothetical protein
LALPRAQSQGINWDDLLEQALEEKAAAANDAAGSKSFDVA